MIRFEVPGDPVPQPRPRVSTRGGFAHAYVPAKHPIHAYRAHVREAARAAGLTARTSPLTVTIEAVFARPASHLLKSGQPRPAAPVLPGPDVDNIAKGVLDALCEFFNDKLVRQLLVRKSYGARACTHVCIE